LTAIEKLTTSITSQRTIETPPPAGLSIAAVYLSDSK